ncbi:hypothetical protein H5410_027248 [Solanum commersonii]|uniref:Uncharacterized protein n=1 Tax=Solanum commersonii TaxID=4109 RepID=A0A9J5Z2W2_SOLCO|nr:hypothetical protein H5410_027248 [Solanum commersonii]
MVEPLLRISISIFCLEPRITRSRYNLCHNLCHSSEHSVVNILCALGAKHQLPPYSSFSG